MTYHRLIFATRFYSSSQEQEFPVGTIIVDPGPGPYYVLDKPSFTRFRLIGSIVQITPLEVLARV